MLLTASLSLSQPGTLDPTFGENGIMFTPIGGLDAGANAVAIQKNGKIVAAGYSRDSAYKRTFALIRYTNHGKLVPSFGNKGIVTTYFPRNNGSVANAITIQNDGKIILAGYLTFGYAFALARY